MARSKNTINYPPGTKFPMATDEALEIVLGLAGPHVATDDQKLAMKIVGMVLAGRRTGYTTTKSKED